VLCVYRRIEGRLQATHVANKNHSLPFFFSLVGWKKTIGLLAMRKGLSFFLFLMFVCLAQNRTK
jgi:hypothetical protein